MLWKKIVGNKWLDFKFQDGEYGGNGFLLTMIDLYNILTWYENTS